MLYLQRTQEMPSKRFNGLQTLPHTSGNPIVEPWGLKMRLTAFRWVRAVVGGLVALEASRDLAGNLGNKPTPKKQNRVSGRAA